MEESKGIEVTKELRNENDELQNGVPEMQNIEKIENEKFQNGSGDNGEHQPLKIKSKVSFMQLSEIRFINSKFRLVTLM